MRGDMKKKKKKKKKEKEDDEGKEFRCEEDRSR
jgi:hypothetical protein